MERRYYAASLLITLLTTFGCSRPQEEGTTTSSADAIPAASTAALSPEEAAAAAQLKEVTGAPDAAVREFLSAVQVGDEERAGLMLTDLARQKTREHDLLVAPPGSPTAKFSVTEFEFVTPDEAGAHVASTWTDFDENGQPHTDKIVWVVRKESYGWRIAGMVTVLYEGSEPLVLNFEDPEDMLRKQELAQKELERLSETPERQAQQNATPAGASQR